MPSDHTPIVALGLVLILLFFSSASPTGLLSGYRVEFYGPPPWSLRRPTVESSGSGGGSRSPSASNDHGSQPWSASSYRGAAVGRREGGTDYGEEVGRALPSCSSAASARRGGRNQPSSLGGQKVQRAFPISPAPSTPELACSASFDYFSAPLY